MDKINLNAEYLTTFNSFDEWVNKAKSRIGVYGKYQKIVCVDSNENICFIGEDFMYARDNNFFPVKAYRLIRSIEKTK